MRRLIIDCQSKKEEVWRDLTAQEEAVRLAEIEQYKTEQRANNRKTAKDQLIKSLAELREMKLNITVFDTQDIAIKQSEIDELKNRLA